MSTETIKRKLESLYSENKSKNFINHLIKSYIPLKKVTKVLERPKGVLMLTCALTNQKLITVDKINSNLLNDEFKANLNSELSLDDTSVVSKTIDGRYIALTGENSQTLLSYNAVKALHEWVNEKVASNDKHFVWLMRNMVGGPLKKKTITAEDNGYRKPSTTFGELDVLKKLKKEFKAQGI